MNHERKQTQTQARQSTTSRPLADAERGVLILTQSGYKTLHGNLWQSQRGSISNG